MKGFPPEEAEELTQEVFLRVYKYSKDFKGKGSFQAWLNTISVNIWKNRIREMRSLKRDAVVVSLDTPGVEGNRQEGRDPETKPLDHTIREELRNRLRKAVMQLPEPVYQCVVLRIYHELSYQQIATVLQLNKETVKSRLYQAQGKLKEILSRDNPLQLL